MCAGPIAPIKAGEVLKMEVLYVEGLANHDGFESWRRAGDHAPQALTGGDAGWVLSRERHYSGVPTRWVTWKATSATTPGQAASLSPMLGNIYLHYAFDLWVQAWRKRHARGDVIVVR